MASEERFIDLNVEGMTCASCVNRVERKLNKLTGVSALVNLATNSARVEVTDPSVGAEELIQAVRAAGYTASLRVPATAAAQSTPPAGVHDAPPAALTAAPPGAAAAAGGGGAATSDNQAPATAAGLGTHLAVCAVLAAPVIALSMFPPLQFPGWQWVIAPLAWIVGAWGAWPFHVAAARAARHGGSTMDTLVSLGVLASLAWSTWALIWGGAGQIGMRMSMTLLPRHSTHSMGAELYFEGAAAIVVFLLLGRFLEGRSRRQAGDALRALLELGAKEVDLVTDLTTRATVSVPVEQLRVGDHFLVRPGQKVATDGVVVDGTSALDESLLTGEPVPVDVAPGDRVTGATLNTSGALLVRATAVGQDTALAQISALVTNAMAGKAPVQRLADRISAVFVPVVISLSLLTFGAWWLWGPSLTAAFTAGVAVLIIACPCALGLATPTALLVGTSAAARRGILIKGPEILESTRALDTVVLDKTGTLTQARMRVEAVLAASPGAAPLPLAGLANVAAGPAHGEALTALRLAGAVEANSEHPIAAAVAEAAREASERLGAGALPPVAAFNSSTGYGVRATVEGAEVAVGRPQWVAQQLGGGATDGTDGADRAAADAAGADADEAAAWERRARELSAQGATVVAVGWGGQSRALLVLRDPLKPEAAQAVAELKALGLTPWLVTGDNPASAQFVAQQVGIENVRAGVLPADKLAIVEELQRSGATVGMVGDGVNDAAALAAAGKRGLGIALGTGTDVAIAAADVTLVRTDLLAVPAAIRLARATLRTIKQNLFWAFFYNVAAIPLAAFGWLNPMIAALAMAFSSVLVVSNSLRLRAALPA
ncbi:heavy metal translocating P-type ATPase [Buchananella felis]|uniref:heavy metal translocating P-type ATPase n=1 Tax=Buchananella felis TaxID=3231492 RepID=UPI003527D7A0